MKSRLKEINEKIDRARALSPSDSPVTLLAVSKKQPTEKIRTLYDLGLRDFGENYVQEAKIKMEELKGLDIKWHFIGRIQSKKIRDLVGAFDLIQTVSRELEAEKISQVAVNLGLTQKILVQVNIADEESKQGFSPDEIENSLRKLCQLPNLSLRGLMVFPPISEDESVTKAWFSQARGLFEKLRSVGGPQWQTLSMGTSRDFHLAIEHQSTLIRLGETLMGPRDVT